MRIEKQFARHVSRAAIIIASLIVALLPARILTNPQEGNLGDRTLPLTPSANGAAPSAKSHLRLAAMRAQVMNARPLAMYYSLDDTFALNSLLEHASAMTVLAPQCFWLDQDGNVQGGVSPAAMEVARQARLPVMALLYNRNFNREIATLFLHDRALQKRAIRKMATIASQEDLLGFQLDLENIDPSDENLYSRFVRDAAQEMHREDRLLSVAVVPRFLGSAPSQWSAAYDYPALARSADFLTLMAYDNSGRLGPPGPIAGYDWVKHAIEYAVQRVPRDKLLLGIPLYGREWSETGDGFQARTMPYQETKAVLERLSIRPQWDEKQRSPWFEYQSNDTVCKVWYENAKSLSAKLRLVERFQLRGFAAWRLGVEDPRLWSLVAAMHESRPTPTPHEYVSSY